MIVNYIIVVLLIISLLSVVALYVYQRDSRRILRNIQKQLHQLHRQQMSHTWATAALHNSVAPADFPLPSAGGWALNSDILAYISARIIHDRTRLVVELGSGLSTVVLGNALKKVGGHLVSVESGQAYLDATKRLVEDAGLEEVVTLVSAPLEPFDDHGRVWYQTMPLDSLHAIDLLIVDGPPSRACDTARYPALPFFRDKLSRDATLILDDFGRPDEKEIVERWKREYEDIRIETLDFARPAAVVTLDTATGPASQS